MEFRIVSANEQNLDNICIYVNIFIVHLFILLCRVIRATSREDPEVVQLVEREYRAVTNSNI